MRIFEILILAVLSIITIINFIKLKNKSVVLKILFTCSLVLCFLHITIEGYRWQMVPAFCLILFFIIVNFTKKRVESKSSKIGFISILFILIIFSFLFGSIITPLVLPVFKFPEPSGNYAIGTRYFVWEDSTRQETFTPDFYDKREIGVQVWYPATITEQDKPEVYWEDSATMSKIWTNAQGLNFLPFLLNHFNLVKTHSYPNVPVSDKKSLYPVLIFSHGYTSFNKAHTALMEKLASHGYIVFSISHPYETQFLIYPDKTIKGLDRDNVEFRKRVIENQDTSYTDLFRDLEKVHKWEQQKTIYQKMYKKFNYWEKSAGIWLVDTRFCIDRLVVVNNLNFSGKLDLNRLGVMGWSYGGATAGLITIIDERIKAGINMDGWQTGHLLETNINKPFMFMYSEHHGNTNDFFFNQAKSEIYSLTIKNSKHTNFNDFALSNEWLGKLSGQLGTVNSRQCIEMINEYVLAFFDKYLKNKESELLTKPNIDFPEVEFKTKNIKSK